MDLGARLVGMRLGALQIPSLILVLNALPVFNKYISFPPCGVGDRNRRRCRRAGVGASRRCRCPRYSGRGEGESIRICSYSTKG
jgi:hypothetical protein